MIKTRHAAITPTKITLSIPVPIPFPIFDFKK
jgi:hypothetical protein